MATAKWALKHPVYGIVILGLGIYTDKPNVSKLCSFISSMHSSIFISVQCPVVRDYMERISKLAADYKARGVQVIGINSNATETTDDIKAHAAANNLTFPVLRDKGNKIADQLGAERTPEVFFLDANNKLVYHGRIDNHRNITLVNANDLRDAIDATLAGKAVVKTEASAFGCSIKRAS